MSVNLQLLNFIEIYRNTIDQSILTNTLKRCNNLEWKLHEWTNYNSVTPSPQSNEEFLRADLTGIEKALLHRNITHCVLQYCKLHNFSINGNSPIVINKYEQGKRLIEHIDHKTNYFTGVNKGIPIITVIGILNNDYTGGMLTLCKNFDVPLVAGDLVIFPSNFLFPHTISTVETGIRYSFNQWFW
jgi:predicted 2-oxoglutarate/Fe(II)-dependent dioxygenase YbiX